jgi:hypothetical protein
MCLRDPLLLLLLLSLLLLEELLLLVLMQLRTSEVGLLLGPPQLLREGPLPSLGLPPLIHQLRLHRCPDRRSIKRRLRRGLQLGAKGQDLAPQQLLLLLRRRAVGRHRSPWVMVWVVE